MKYKKNYLIIITIAIILACLAISLLFPLFRIKLNPIAVLFITPFFISIVLTVISLLKLEPSGRILAIVNLILLSGISLGGMFFNNPRHFGRVIFWGIVFFVSASLIFLLSSRKIKELFKTRGRF